LYSLVSIKYWILSRCLLVSLGALLFSSYSLHAQVGHYNSPYSFYGLGDLQSPGLADNLSQGHTGIAMRSLNNISLSNPASYTGLYFTCFDLGVHVVSSSLNDSNNTQTVSGTGISYLNLAFPATPWLAFSGGLAPYSQVDYTVDEVTQDEELGEVQKEYDGFGSLYRFYGGAAGKYKRLSAGFNLAYLFGNQTHLLNVAYPDQQEDISSFLDIQRNERNQYGGLMLDFGVQYDWRINESTNLVFGATYKPKVNIGYQSQQNWQRVVKNSLTSEVFNVDSVVVFDISELDSEITLPQELGFGFELKSQKGWSFSGDIKTAAWSKAVINRLEADQLQDRFSVSLGTSLSPNSNKEGAINNFWRRVEYRFGMYYDSNYLKLNNTSLPAYGITLGFGIPLRGKVEAGLLDSGVPFSRLNLSFDLGQKGSTDNQLLQETYFKLTLGFSMNSKWFVKRRYD